MRLFGLFGKEKAVPFTQFSDSVRQELRRIHPGATFEPTANGFVFTVENTPVACNLRSLYAAYTKTPNDRDALIKNWMGALATPVPEQSWSQACVYFRPTLKDAYFLAQATRELARMKDELPSSPFVGELSVVVVRDLPGKAVFVTNKDLQKWGVTFEQALQQALDNFNMSSFPSITNTMQAGGSSRKGTGDVVGLVFEGDHLTATWLLMERFRDYLGQRLQGDCVVCVPHRSRLVAVRADEPALVNSMLSSNRPLLNDTHALTSQRYFVNAAVTGGEISVYQPGAQYTTRDATGQVRAGASPAAPSSAPPPDSGMPMRPRPVDLSTWGELQEDTRTPPNHKKGAR